ncbi:transposase [Streptomyces sp. CBMA123]|uniref:transposase n=1 Tax=Streptomyces sp. CBMA123 TaxID=1896313 RepID=UPI001661C61B|nr:transposase [Streptomyces sp. CBMA123]
MSAAEWAVVRDAVPVLAWLEGRGGQPEGYCHRQTVDAVLHLIPDGIAWREVPKDLPAWDRVYAFFRRWRDCGLVAEFHDRLRSWVREAAGRDPEPTAGIVDAQSTKAASSGPREPGIRHLVSPADAPALCLTSARVQLLSELVFVEVAGPTMTRPRTPTSTTCRSSPSALPLEPAQSGMTWQGLAPRCPRGRRRTAPPRIRLLHLRAGLGNLRLTRSNHMGDAFRRGSHKTPVSTKH